MASSNTQAAPNSICCALFSRGDEKFHWTIVIPSNNNTAVMLHARNPVGGWSFERKEHNVYSSKSVCVIVKIGTVTKTNSVDHITDLLKNIPMTVPAVDHASEPTFTCRVWFKQAVRVLAANGVLKCPNVNALEKEIIAYGQAQDAATITAKGYKYHIASAAS